MHEDGGATIAERVRFSRKLLELDHQTPGDVKLVRLLERKAVEERMAHMGKGITLVRHTLTKLQDGSRESVAAFKIPDIEDLRLPNPYLDQAPPSRMMRFRFSPIYKFVHSYHRVGELMLALVPAVEPRRRSDRRDGEPPPGPTPAELQALRDLRPVFVDLMEGLELKLRLMATKPISYGHVREKRAGSKTITLFSFTDSDLDAHGQRFIENEELMLSILRLRLDAEILTDHTQDFARNLTLPVFRGRKPYASGRFRIQPTRHLFRKYYGGRPRSQGGDMPDK
jgi:hypothetical protein